MNKERTSQQLQINHAGLALPLRRAAQGRRPAHERPPLQAGHPVSWGLLTDGTPLDGAPYPYPVFDVSK